MADELQTEPGWKPPREKKPWWAVAIAGGFGAVLAVLFALGLLGPSASAHEPTVRTSGISAPVESPQRMDRIEQRLNEISERLARIEGRLERR